MDNVKVGDLVYEPYSPAKCGKVVDKRKTSPYPHRPEYVQNEVLVRFTDGVEKWIWEVRLKNYRKLYEDHERKAAKMIVAISILEKL